MTLNRYILKNHNIEDIDIANLIRKSKTLNAGYCLKTITTEKGRIAAVAHFDSDELKEKLNQSIKTLRPDYIKHSKRLLRILKSIDMAVL